MQRPPPECGTPSLSVSFATLNGDFNCPGSTYTYTYTATDPCGRTAQCMQTFTIADNPEPTITCPADQTVECSADIMVSADNATVTAACTLSSDVRISGPVVAGIRRLPRCDLYLYLYSYG